MGLDMDPQVLADLMALRGGNARALPPVGDIDARRSNASATVARMPLSHPEDARVEVQRHWLTTDEGAKLSLDWYHHADAEPPGSAVLYLHGGGMILGLSELGKLMDTAVRHYVAASGVPMLMVDYRTAPEHPHPVPVEDCYAALQWLARNAPDFGADPARLAVMGDSAGGGLAAATCLLARDRGGPPIAQQLLVYPMLDDRTSVPDPHLVPFLTWTYDDNVTGWTALLGKAFGSEQVSPYAAPARARALGGLPPAYLEVGELDILRDETIVFARRLAAAGIPTELHVHLGCPHTFDWLAPGAEVSRRVVADRVRRLRAL